MTPDIICRACKGSGEQTFYGPDPDWPSEVGNCERCGGTGEVDVGQTAAYAEGRKDEHEESSALVAEMLTALRIAEAHLHAISHPDCGKTEGDPLHTIRAAIAKATGSTS